MAKKSPKNSSSKKKVTSRAKGKVKKSATKKKAAVSKKSKKKPIHLDKNKGLGLYIRIKSLLWKTYKSDYQGLDYRSKDSEFLKVVHKVYEECKTSGVDCPDDVLITKYQEIVGHKKRPEPSIAPELYQEARPYWEIKDIEFPLFAPYLWIVSPMILSPPSEFQISDYVDSKGNVSIGYDAQFKQWVDWCNYEFRDNASDNYGAYFIFTKPEWNEEKERWETEIYICTAGGIVYDFGYIPIGGSPVEGLPTQFPVAPEEKISEPSKAAKVETKSEKLLNKKLGYIEEIKMWKEIGDKKEMNAAIVKLKAINKEIDKLS